PHPRRDGRPAQRLREALRPARRRARPRAHRRPRARRRGPAVPGGPRRPPPGPPARRAGVRPRRQCVPVPAGGGAAARRDPRHGARPADARGPGGVPAGRPLVPGEGRRRDLDALVLPAVVRGDGQDPGGLPVLQGRQPRPARGGRMNDLPLHVNVGRLSRELDELAGFSDAPPPAVTRVLYTEADLKARAFLRRLCGEAELLVREDPIGNLFARWEGSEPSLPAVGTGSHTDAIPHSGKYDGTVGVLGGLEAVRALMAA